MYYLILVSLFILSCQPKAEVNTSATALISTYFKLQQAFSQDNFEHTAHYIMDMKKSLKDLKLEDETVKNRISASLDAYNGITDIKEQRNLFQELSNSVALVVNRVGYTADIYVMQCPMAFEGKGGTWLQASADLVNPYYGSEMLKCGDQVTVITAKN